MKKLLIAMTLAFAALTASAEWLPIANGTKGTTYEGLSHSLRYETNKQGEPVAIIGGRIRGNDTTRLVQWSVPRADCLKGSGTVYTHNIKGDVTGENEFITDGGNIISAVGETICTVVNHNSASSK